MTQYHKFKSIKEVSRIVNEMAKKIQAGRNDLPTFGSTNDFARPHVEIDHKGYHFITVERGREVSRKTTVELNDFLYIVFEYITRVISMNYELKNRDNDRDSRRKYFLKQEELIGKLNPNWQEKVKSEHLLILKKNPYDDYARARAILCGKFREEGCSDEKAWELACEKYPMNQGTQDIT